MFNTCYLILYSTTLVRLLGHTASRSNILRLRPGIWLDTEVLYQRPASLSVLNNQTWPEFDFFPLGYRLLLCFFDTTKKKNPGIKYSCNHLVPSSHCSGRINVAFALGRPFFWSQ